MSEDIGELTEKELQEPRSITSPNELGRLLGFSSPHMRHLLDKHLGNNNSHMYRYKSLTGRKGHRRITAQGLLYFADAINLPESIKVELIKYAKQKLAELPDITELREKIRKDLESNSARKY
jgi:hypothetical protein